MFKSLPAKEILLVILGGLFGWMLGKLPINVVYGVMAIAIILIIIVMK